MSSVDVNETYEKLRQIYETRYTNPKEVLYYRINELVRKGRTREEAILALYEEEKKKEEEAKEAIKKGEREEAIKQQIYDYERSVERLTILFSKGEIGEESYKKATETIEKNIDKLRKEITTPPSRPSYTPYVGKPTIWWYLVPFFFGLLGGVLAYIAVKDEDKEMAESLLGFGIIMTVINIFISLAIYWYIISMLF